MFDLVSALEVFICLFDGFVVGGSMVLVVGWVLAHLEQVLEVCAASDPFSFGRFWLDRYFLTAFLSFN